MDNAIQAHANWRKKLRLAANKSEQIDADTAGRDDCCELGKWLHGAGSSIFGGRPTFVALVDRHRAFHTEAGNVARVINQGNGAQAEKMLGSGTRIRRPLTR
ncbi:MAG: CZB domain-containing protein [Rhodoferax sp.]|nr:CZB domain-containing protein [Rhodoferax sp.]